MAWIYVSTKVDSYQQQPNSGESLSKAGWVRLRGRERHGWRDRAYMDLFTASPAIGPTPPSHGTPRLLLLLRLRLPLPLLLRVQGAALPATHPLPR